MAGTVKGLVVEIGGDTSGLQKALSKVNTATASLTKELKGINSLLKLDPSNTELLSQKQLVLKDAIKATADKLTELNKVKEEADKAMASGTEVSEQNYRALQREIEKTQRELADLQNQASNWTKAGEALQKFGDSLSKLGSNLSNIGSKLTTSLTLPISALATAGVAYDAQIEKYETAFSTFLGSAEEASKAIKNLKDDAKKTPFDTTSIVKANQMLISTGESAEGARDNILALGNAVIATGGGNDELVRMSSNLQQIKNAGKATAMDIRQFAYAGIDVYGILADYMGKTTQEVKGLEISYEDLTNALKKASSEGGKYYGSMDKASGTLVGQVSSLKSEFQEMIGELTKSLMPIAKKVVEKVRDLIKQFDSLSDSQKENIVRIGLLVASIAPLLKILGSATTIIGGVSKGVGTFTKAIGLLKNGIGDATGSSATLAKMISGLASPVGVLVAGITLLAGAYALFNARTEEGLEPLKKETEAVQAQNEEVQKVKQSWDDLSTTKQKQIDEGMSELNYYESLMGQLEGLVDENGKVKEGYEQRAEFITSTLNDALGLEIQLNDGIIQNYQDLRSEFDKTIEKKKAMLILEAQEEKYKKAISEKANALREQAKLESEIAQDQIERRKLLNDIENAYSLEEQTRIRKQLEELNKQTRARQEQLDTQKELVNEYNYTINQYEQNALLAHEGKYNEMANIDYQYVKTMKTTGDQKLDELNKQLEDESRNLQSLLALKEKFNTDEYDKEIEQSEKIIAQKEKEMADYQEAVRVGVENASQDWKTGLETQLSYINGKQYEFKTTANGMIQMYVDGVEQGQPIAETTMRNFANAMNNELDPLLEYGEDGGKNMIKGVKEGVSNNSLQSSVFRTIANFGTNLLAKLKGSLKEHSPSKATEQMGEYLMEGLKIGIQDEEASVNKEVEKVSKSVLDGFDTLTPNIGGINKSVVDSTKTIFTTPQITFNVNELDEQRLQQCFNYVNRKFGSAY